MTRVRHRRYSDPALPFPGVIEPGEIAVNTANRQIAVGDAAAGSPGVSTPLLAVRIFDARGKYVVGDHMVSAGQLYRCIVAHGPAAFDAAHFELIAGEDHTAQLLADYLPLAGGSMTGPLHLVLGAPTANNEAANKKYVDDQISSVAIGGVGAVNVANTPGGDISATNVQDAIDELDFEKAPLLSPEFDGTPTAPTPASSDNSTKIATTAFFAGQASTALPAMDGTSSYGNSLLYARADHVHPTDSTRAPLSSPALTDVPTAPTAALGTNTDQIATTKFVLANPSPTVADGAITYAKMAASALATAAQFLSRTASKILTVEAVWAAAAPVTITDAASVAPDLNAGIDFIWTIGASGRTVGTPQSMSAKVGQKGMIYIVQGGTGSNTIASWATAYKFPGGTKPVLSAAVGAIDVMSYAVKNSAEVHCFFARDMK